MTDIGLLIEQQLIILQQLELVISKESSALEYQKPDLLMAIAKEKATLLTSLNDNDNIISKHPQQGRLVVEDELAIKVEQAKQQLRHCQQLNRSNASLMEMQHASVNRLAQAMQACRNSHSMTYDDKGQTSTIASLGSNIKA